MRYSIEPKDRIYVKGCGFLSFAKNEGTYATKVAKNLSNKCSQKLPDTAKKSTADTVKTDSKRAIQKTVEATGGSIGNKIGDKRTNISKNSSTEVQSKINQAHDEIEIPNEKCLPPEKRQQIIDELKIIYNNIIII